MHNDLIVEATLSFIKEEFKAAEGGHDFHHSYRVWTNAKVIAAQIECNQLVVHLGALLHDIADSKFHNGDETIGPAKASQFLHQLGIDQYIIDHVIAIIENISFGGGLTKRTFNSVELDIVQDADRLEAIGAIGIARTFNYGGFKGFPIFDPEVAPKYHMEKEEYKKHKAPTINHFYEKLLLLKDKMNTEPGRTLARERHEFMVNFLRQFYEEVGFKVEGSPFAL